MLTQKIVCDRCKAEVNGGGYCISYESAGSGIRIAIALNGAIRGCWSEHFCGKQCLMLALNEMVDGLTAIPVQLLQPPLSPFVKGESEGFPAGGNDKDGEEHYEDHMA